MQLAIEQQKNNIIFRSFYLIFGVLLTLLGLSEIFADGGELLLGLGGVIVGTLFTIHSIFVLRKWIIYLKAFKEEKKKKVFDDKTDRTT